jgi:hypothetical protein
VVGIVSAVDILLLHLTFVRPGVAWMRAAGGYTDMLVGASSRKGNDSSFKYGRQ